jgi:hypothetical protein
MRFPKWLVTLLILFSTVGVMLSLGCWWLVWPQQTARLFVDALLSGNREQVERLLLTPPSRTGDALKLSSGLHAALEWLPRDAADVFSGRQRFLVESVPLTFTAQHGTITVERFRTITMKNGDKITLKLWDMAKRIKIDSKAVDVRTDRSDPTQLLVSAMQSGSVATITIEDRSGAKYEVRVTVAGN